MENKNENNKAEENLNSQKDSGSERKIYIKDAEFNEEEAAEENEPAQNPAPVYVPFSVPAERIIGIAIAAILIGLIALIVIRSTINSKGNSNRTEIIQEESEEENSEETTELGFSVAEKNVLDTLERNKITVYPILNYSIFGDEYVTGDSSIDSFSNIMAQLLNANLYDISSPYEDMIQIAARQGGFPAMVQPFTIPAETTPVEIELKDVFSNPLTFSFGRNGGLNPCKIASVDGVIEKEGDVLTFTRSREGKETVVSKPVPLFTKAMFDKRSDRIIIFAGNEDLSDVDKLVSCYKQMINFTDPLKKSYIIVGVINGSDAENALYDKKMTEEFSRNYVNARKYLAEYGLQDAGLQADEIDEEEMSRGVVPSKFYGEDSTLNRTANVLLARLVYERMAELSML